MSQEIDFIGPAGKTERDSIKKKMDKIHDKNSEYSCHLEKDVLAIPNKIPLPDCAKVLDIKDELQAYYLEDVLHQKNIEALASCGQKAFVMKGFNSLNCLQVIRDQGIKSRKTEYDEFNEHEKAVMEILQINEINEKDLQQYLHLHEKYVNDTNQLAEVKPEIKNLFNKGIFIEYFHWLSITKGKLMF